MDRKWISNLIRVIFSVCIFVTLALCTVGFFSNGKLFGIIIFFITIILLFAFCLIIPKDNKKIEWVLISVIIIGMIIRLVYASSIDIQVKSDQLACLKAAQDLLNNNYGWTESSYFLHYPYQIPFVFYEFAVLKVFGSVRALYVFNAVFSITTCLLLYVIVKIVTNRKTALIVAAIHAILPSSVFMIHWLYNHIISGVFFLLAILFFLRFFKKASSADIKLNDIVNCLLAGVFLGISNLFRPEGMVGVIAVIAWFIYSFINTVQKATAAKMILKTLILAFSFLLGYILINNIINIVVINTISPLGIKNPCIYWTVVCGLTPEKYGSYSTKYDFILDCTDKQEQRNVFISILHDIFDRMTIVDIFKFFTLKLYYLWGILDTGCAKFSDGADVPAAVTLGINCLEHILYFLMLYLSAYNIKKKTINQYTVFFMILFIGFFSAFIIKEIKKEYLYSTNLILLLLSSSGISCIIDDKQFFPYSQIKRRFSRRSQKA